jgi:hypothetical protein
MLAAKLANLSNHRPLKSTENSVVSQSEAAELFGVSADLVGFARRVQEDQQPRADAHACNRDETIKRRVAEREE